MRKTNVDITDSIDNYTVDEIIEYFTKLRIETGGDATVTIELYHEPYTEGEIPVVYVSYMK